MLHGVWVVTIDGFYASKFICAIISVFWAAKDDVMSKLSITEDISSLITNEQSDHGLASETEGKWIATRWFGFVLMAP